MHLFKSFAVAEFDGFVEGIDEDCTRERSATTLDQHLVEIADGTRPFYRVGQITNYDSVGLHQAASHGLVKRSAYFLPCSVVIRV